MKKNIKYIATLLLGIVISCGCTDSFESFNTNKAGFNDEQKKADFHYYCISLGIVQQGIYFNYDWGGGRNWPFQIMQNLGTDLFSGYLQSCEPFNSARNNSTYYMMDGWNGSLWENTYGYILPEVQKSEDINETLNIGFWGISRILKVELMHRITDVYGPIIYTKFGDKTGSMPDTQEQAYTEFFLDLDKGMAKIEEHLAAHPDMNNFANFDLLMPEGRKTYSEWLRFANSLRLRLAVRIAMANPTLAKAEAQKAISHSAGLLQENDEIIAVSTETGYINPLGEISNGWRQTNMSANTESILGGYEDPRISKLFRPATGVSTQNADLPGIIPYRGTFKGIRQGTGFSDRNYYGHSNPTMIQTTSPVLMNAAEVWFLRAEAALRGWSNESVKTCYENGIRASFAQWGAANVESYLESTKAPKDYIDAFNVTRNIAAISTVTPKWDDAVNNELKLEKIITQKWIACCPEGCEGWAEQRRTGYPKLFPVLVNESGGTVDTNKGPRRLNFPVNIITANPEQYSALVTALGGTDNCGTNLWWDTGRNF